ncbi:MAG: RNA polymerase sigma-70 factor [Bacteroidales bacterium]|nr:RNA polymerase sigma-70 factor [Bacteroidales bacterium]
MKHLPDYIELQLVKSLKKGDVLAFNNLFSYYGQRLYHFSYGYLRSVPECEELVQEVFTKVWEKRSELKEELSFRSYIFTIAFNIIRKQFRSRAQTDTYIQSQLLEDFSMETTENIDFNSLKNQLTQLVSRLPSRRKEIFTKSRIEGFSVKEIAEEMNISKKTVENQLTEALRFIRSNLTRERIAGLLFFYLFVAC